ncbi:MAG: hypothetical protein NTZ29_09960, partial [Verrucomicrobia bacterium]|nr:hypothetical protein [Verrucomicrobiota bacterium]
MLGTVPAPLGFAAQYDFEKIPCGVEVATDDGAIWKEVDPFTEQLLAGRATARTSLAGLVLAGIHIDDGATSFFRFVTQHLVESPRCRREDFSVESLLRRTAVGGHGERGQEFDANGSPGGGKPSGGLMQKVLPLTPHLVVEPGDGALGQPTALGALGFA